MKFNIFKTIVPLAAIAVGGAMSSCVGDLTFNSASETNDPTINKEFNPIQMYSKCYASMIMEGNDGSADFDIDNAGKSTLVRNIYNLECLGTDESSCWWTDGGLVNVTYNQPSAEDQLMRFMYYRVMSNITYCNHYITNDNCIALGKDKLAEVRWIRAFNYYTLANEFGNIPFTLKISGEAPVRATRVEMYDWLISELKEIIPDLLDAEPRNSENVNYGRVDKAAAYLLLSRIYLNAQVWHSYSTDEAPDVEKIYEGWEDGGDAWHDAMTQASYYAKLVVDSKYDLNMESTDIDSVYSPDGKTDAYVSCNIHYTAYDKLFMADNMESSAYKEAILPLKQDGYVTQGWGGTMYFIAAHWDTNMKTVADISAGTTAVDWSGNRVREQLVEKFTSDATKWSADNNQTGYTAKQIRLDAGDDRALFWGVGKSVSLGDNTAFDQGMASVKFNNRRSDGAPAHDTYCVDGDFMLLRYAEALLNYAEAECRLAGGSISAGEASKSTPGGCISLLRQRANCKKSMTVYTLDDILDERAREFYLEGYRRTDLIRFHQYGGNQATYQWERKNGTNPGTNFPYHYNLYPLPSTELLANENLKQNPGY